jgi:general secretion pathway protein D
MHHDDAVSLALKIDLSSISGKGFGDLPTFGSRQINTVIRLKDGETNMLAGLIRDEERTSMAGIPGLSDIPVIGRLFAYNHKETTTTDIILTLTPRIIRVLNVSAADLEPFRVGRDGGAPVTDVAPLLPIPLPLPAPKPPGAEAPAEPGLAPSFPTIPGPAQPLKPPPIKPPKH